VAAECRRRGSKVEVVAADLVEVGVPARLVEAAAGGLRGPRRNQVKAGSPVLEPDRLGGSGADRALRIML
jgi:hypothetical protein